jgi:hypothetical protein
MQTGTRSGEKTDDSLRMLLLLNEADNVWNGSGYLLTTKLTASLIVVWVASPTRPPFMQSGTILHTTDLWLRGPTHVISDALHQAVRKKRILQLAARHGGVTVSWLFCPHNHQLKMNYIQRSNW